MLTQNSFSAWGLDRYLWPAGIVSQLYKWMSTEKGERTLSWVTWRVTKPARSRLWVPKPGSLLSNNYHLLKKNPHLRVYKYIWFHTEILIEDEKKKISFIQEFTVCLLIKWYLSVSRCIILNSYEVSFEFNLRSWCQQGGRTVDISSGQQLLCKILLKKHLYLSPKATDVACKASRATKWNQHEEMDFEPALL